MIYECEDKYLTASLLTFKGFEFLGCTKKDKIYFLIRCDSKNKLIKKLEQHLNKSLKVDFEKFKISISIIENELSDFY